MKNILIPPLTVEILRLPYNWKTPLGYLITLVFQAVAAISTFLSFIPTICLLCGSCFLIIAFVDDISNDLDILNNIDGGGMSRPCHRIVKERFCNTIQFHTDLKGLVTVKYVEKKENDTITISC